MPVPVFVAVTVTPGIKAFDGSATVPPTEALIDCPNPLTERIKHSSDTATAHIDFLVISTFLLSLPRLRRRIPKSSSGKWCHSISGKYKGQENETQKASQR
jgi:hypothetical protein